MEHTAQQSKQATWERAGEIVAGLRNSSYTINFQPTYLDEPYLTEAVHELITTEPATKPAYVDSLSRRLGAIAEGRDTSPVVITGHCSERVTLRGDLSQPAQISLRGLEIVAGTKLAHAVHIRRERGQNNKPRSEETELLPNGDIVISYQGDLVNDPDPARREPDPARLVSAALQARDIEKELIESLDRHLPAAHEALNLYYEKAFIHSSNGKDYLLSADLPWVGVRTNQPDSDQVNLLSGVANPVGVKLDATTTPDHLAALASRLNPDQIPGKLTLMIRFGIHHIDQYPEFLEAVREHAPNSILLYDIHGSTLPRTVNTDNGPVKYKIRYTGDIIHEIKALAKAGRAAALPLHGVHLETSTDETRLECVDNSSDLPTHSGGIDPQLNPRQTKEVLDAVARDLSR